MANNFWCPNHLDEEVNHRSECTLCDSKGHVTSNEKKLVCPIAEKLLKLMGHTTFSIKTKMTKQQIKADRTKRSHDHFNKEIFPTLGADEKAHHIAKRKRRNKNGK